MTVFIELEKEIKLIFESEPIKNFCENNHIKLMAIAEKSTIMKSLTNENLEVFYPETDPFVRLYDKIKDLPIPSPTEFVGKAFGYPVDSIIRDCIILQQTEGTGVTETLDIVLPRIGYKVWWMDPAEVIFKLVEEYIDITNRLAEYDKQNQISL